ncbi:DUF1294 domain-containing protein [Streptococcus dentasini]
MVIVTVAGLLLAWNIIAFSLYGLDKRRAVRGDWRISERSLLFMSLTGAGIGSYLAARLFRHKILKWYFRICWYLGLLIDAVIIYVLWSM